MTLLPVKGQWRKTCLVTALLLAVSPFGRTVCYSQVATESQPSTERVRPESEFFRLERVPIAGGAELITIRARMEGLPTTDSDDWVPLVSVLRDNLGDLDPENDRLRYVWPLTYTRPSLTQRVLGAVPFLYTRAGNQKRVSQGPPPPALDLAAPEGDVWNAIFWTALQNILLDPYGMPVKASTRSYQRNISDYRKSHIIRALSVLSLYQALNNRPTFSEAEIAEIHSRLTLTDRMFGGLVDDLNLQRFYDKSTAQQRDERAQNWELLRQRAEAESLYFEPLQLPDGSSTHALLWISKSDLEQKPNHPFNGRFLNFSDPWSDKRLRNWEGYSETRYFDAENRIVAADTPDARPVEMIPLALYGLDSPKIPMLLVDFRDSLNPKKREISRRVLQDVTRNILSLSKFGNLPYFVGRTVFDFVTGRRGMDVNQPSRMRTYSQLKLLLALDVSLQPELREELTHRLEKVAVNPLENDLDVETNIARQQYQALLTYATNPKGLPAKLDRDRRAELVPLAHGRAGQILFRLANILSFGKYVHREQPTEDMEMQLDIARRIAYHTEFLRRVAKSNFQIDVAWNLEDVRRSLAFIAEHGAGSGAIKAAGQIFVSTQDEETRRACLESLARINSAKARNELLKISANKNLDNSGRDLIKTFISQNNSAQSPTTAASVKSGLIRADQ